jgi:glycosyltransferase involved in cell wall biosynthesis
MKILFLHLFDLNFGWGGSSSYLLAMSKAIREAGHVVRACTKRCPDKYGLSTSELAFPTHVTFGPEKRIGERTIDEISTDELIKLAEESADVIKDVEFSVCVPDLIIANHISITSHVAFILNSRFGIPYRIISYGTDSKLLASNPRYVSLFEPAVDEAERILAISDFVKKEVSKTVGGRVEVIGGAVDKELFFPSKVLANNRRIVFVGRIVSEKGVEVLLHAFSRQNVAKQLIIIGEGPKLKEMQSTASDLGIADRVFYTGYLPPDKIRDYIVSAEVVVVPSIWEEPLGLVAMEAFACGVPVVASRVGGLPEVVKTHENGLLVPPGDIEMLASTIVRLLSDRHLYSSLRKGALASKVPMYRDLVPCLIGE